MGEGAIVKHGLCAGCAPHGVFDTGTPESIVRRCVAQGESPRQGVHAPTLGLTNYIVKAAVCLWSVTSGANST